MKASWNTLSLESLYLEPSRNGLNRPKSVRGAGYQMVNMGELFAFDRIANPPMERVQMTEAETAKFSLKTGDLLFARQSLVLEGAGKCSIVLTTPETTTFESHLIRVRLDPCKADAVFYYYYFKSPTGKAGIRSLVNQVAAAGIRGSELAKLLVLYPPLSVQHKIAVALSAYDYLIETNTRRIQILEEMAQALYREWFVHFRFPGHEQSKMVESALGLIPEGWEFRRLGDFAQETRRSVDINKVAPETPYVGLEHIPRKSIALHEWGRADEVHSTKLKFDEGDILFGKIRPYFHKVSIAPIAGICSSDIIVVKPKQPEYYAIALCCISSDDFVGEATQTSQGTKMPRANWEVLTKFPIAMPPEHLLTKFNDFALNSFTLIKNLATKNKNLRQTRDLLLPKLISGEFAVDKFDVAELIDKIN